MKPQNLFDQKIKAVIRSGIQQGDDQPHAFSAEYEQKKQEILQQAQRKSIRVTSRSCAMPMIRRRIIFSSRS